MHIAIQISSNGHQGTYGKPERVEKTRRIQSTMAGRDILLGVQEGIWKFGEGKNNDNIIQEIALKIQCCNQFVDIA